MSENFQTGTVTNKSAQEVWDLLKIAVKNYWHTDAKEIKPVFDNRSEVVNSREIVGFTITHAEPLPRKERSDKGRPRAVKSTEPKIEQKAPKSDKPAPKSPFASTDQKVAS